MSFGLGGDLLHLEEATGPTGVGVDDVDDIVFDEVAKAIDSGIAFAGGDGHIDAGMDAGEALFVFRRDGVFVEEDVELFERLTDFDGVGDGEPWWTV